MLKIINYYFLQWFFIRLTRCSKKVITQYNLSSIDMMSDSSFASRGTGIIEETFWYSIQGWIIPLSGWGKSFKYLNKEPFFLRLTKKKIK